MTRLAFWFCRPKNPRALGLLLRLGALRWALGLGLLLGGFPGLMQAVPLAPHQDKIDLNRHYQHLLTPPGELTIETVSIPAAATRFTPNEPGKYSYGFTNQDLWLKLEVQNPSSLPQVRWLEFLYPLVDEIVMFQPTPTGWTRRVTGDHYSLSQKELAYANNLLVLDLAPGEQKTLYFRVRSESTLLVPLLAWTPQGFVEQTYKYRLFFGLVLGVILLMSVYNLFLLFMLRRGFYLYFVFYICMSALYSLGYSGLATQYLWPEHPLYSQLILFWSISLASLAAWFFFKSFLELELCWPWSRWIGYGVVGLSLLLPPLTLLGYYRACGIYASLFGAGTVLLYWLLSFFRMVQGDKTARLVFLALCLNLFGLFLAVSRLAGFSLPAQVGVYSHQLGILGALLLYSAAIAYKLGKLRSQAEAAEKALIESLQRENQLKTDQAQTLEREVDNRTQALGQANQELVRLHEEKKDFFGITAHDLRGGVGTILGYLELYKTEASPEEKEKYINVLRDVAGSMVNLISNVMEVGFVEESTIKYNPKIFSLAQVLAQVTALETPAAHKKGIQLVLQNLEPPQRMLGDDQWLAQILSNLISNAIKYSPGQTVVTVEASLKGATLRVEVKDQGPGIPPKEQSRLFTRFGRLSAKPTGGEFQTGLGLYGAKLLVNRMGGEIGCEPNPTGGSVFWVTFPEPPQLQGKPEPSVLG